MTTNISKIQAAIASVTQETTLALFNLNLDCSLIKVDAPAEYLPFGNALTKRRRTQAEAGSAHRIARKLGMLFEDIVPRTPALIKAYGTRATEIIEFYEKPLSSKLNGKSDYGPFVDYVGVDGTSIWAAATSSGAAIAIHLLACLLATAFEPAEAVAIWEQIVQARKEDISNFEDGDLRDFRTLAASTWDISRQELTSWDGSARAWINSANLAKKLQCHQLRLILDNIDLPVHYSVDPYQSVIETWQTCLKMMDNLIQGNGQDIQNGGLLVAFRAWHIFPDMILLRDGKHVQQKDPLVGPGGVVTIGLERLGSLNNSGVNWSLSLSHLQFYGDMERRNGYLSSDKERISVSDMWAFLLGFCFALVNTNMLEFEQKINIAARIHDSTVLFLQEYPVDATRGFISDAIKTTWVYKVGEVSKRYFQYNNEEKRRFRQLAGLGHKSFHKSGFWGFTLSFAMTSRNMIKHSGRQGRERQIELLRGLTARIPRPAAIRLVYMREHSPDSPDQSTWQLADFKVYEFDPRKLEDKLQVDLVLLTCHTSAQRKLVKSLQPLSQSQEELLEGLLGRFETTMAESVEELLEHHLEDPCLYIFMSEVTSMAPGMITPWRDLRQLDIWSYLKLPDIEFLVYEDSITEDFMIKLLQFFNVPQNSPVFDYLLDMSRVSALYEGFDAPLIDLTHMATCFRIRPERPSMFDLPPSTTLAQLLLDYTMGQNSTSKEIETNNLGLSYTLLRDFPIPNQLRQFEAFELIRFLESKGTLLEDYSSYTSRTPGLTMAISSEDSLFVASQFLQDPSVSLTTPPSIIRLPGNIGRPGIILLTAPKNPRYSAHNDTLLEDAVFDGRLIDCFGSTTLHLVLTGYELPIQESGQIGARHHQTWVFEATTSVHQAGKWIGDINPLESAYLHPPLSKGGYYSVRSDSSTVGYIRRYNSLKTALKPQRQDVSLFAPSKCNVCGSELGDTYSSITNLEGGVLGGITSMDCWGEYFNRPSNYTVFRARGNWAARLAAVCFSEKIKAPVIPIHPQTCKCRVERLLCEQSSPVQTEDQIGLIEGVCGVLRGDLPNMAYPPGHEIARNPRRAGDTTVSFQYYNPIYLL